MPSAIVLPVEKVSGTEAQVIPGVPGRWRPGVFYAVDVIGLTEKEMAALIASDNLPLEIVQVTSSEPLAPHFDATPNHVPSDYMDAAATRDAAAALGTPDAIITSKGLVVEPASPAPDSAEPWAKDQIARDTAANLGETDASGTAMPPHVAGVEAAGGGMNARDGVDPLAGRKAEVEALTTAELDERYAEVDGYPSSARKADKTAWALEHEGLVIADGE